MEYEYDYEKHIDMEILLSNESTNPCDKCPNNYMNGGSGVCCCSLSVTKIT